MKVKKSWVEKRDNPAPGVPEVFKVEGKMASRWGTKAGDTCAIPHPKDVDGFMKKVPYGRIITINSIREAVAKKYKATIGCPITSGIFAWISAHAAEEERAQGKKDATPWWRTIKTDGTLNPKYPGGA